MSVARDLVYVFLFLLLSPYFLYKAVSVGKYRAGLRQKLGAVPARGPGGRLWIHAVSVGEVKAARPLVEALARAGSKLDVVLSTTTETGQAVARDVFGGDKTFYYPFDLSFAVGRALRRTGPSAVVLMELEVWPNFAAAAARRGIPVMVANGRVTERSFRRYGRIGALLRPTFRSLARVAAQDGIYAERFRRLGVLPERVKVVGSMKYDAVKTDPSPGERGEMRSKLGMGASAPVLVAGSTHPGEEERILAAYGRLRGDFAALRLVIVPRHPERFAPVVELVAAGGFPVQRKTALDAGAPPDPGAVVVGDTMGELSAIYAAADAVFVGGSLIPHGGQNVAEPAGLGIPAVMGPSMFNFQELADGLAEAGGALRISTDEELVGALGRLLGSPGERGRMGERARSFIESRKGAAERTLSMLMEILPGNAA